VEVIFLRSERGSAILEYLLILGAAAMIYFGGPLLIHGVQDWLALANAERVAMHQVAVSGYYSGCAQQRLDEALQAANIPVNLVSAQGTITQQQYGQPVSLALQYTYSPAAWIHIPLSAGSQTISQYLPGQVAGGGCPPASNTVVSTGPNSLETLTIFANPSTVNVNQPVTFSGEVIDRFGNPAPNYVYVSGGGQAVQVYASDGYYSAVLTFSSLGTVTVSATVQSVSASTQVDVVSNSCPLTATFSGPSLPSGWWWDGTPQIQSWNPLTWNADIVSTGGGYNGMLVSPTCTIGTKPVTITLQGSIPNGNTVGYSIWEIADTTSGDTWALLGTNWPDHGVGTYGCGLQPSNGNGSETCYPSDLLTSDGGTHTYRITVNPGQSTITYEVDNNSPIQSAAAGGTPPIQTGDQLVLEAFSSVYSPSSNGNFIFQLQSVTATN
jgi:hypothetical protein